MTKVLLAGLCCGIGALGLLTGCVSKARADRKAREAFMAGQQHAIQQMQLRGTVVTVVGEVRNPLVPWTSDLTLARAILAAEYFGATDPVEILVTRAGEEIRLDPRALLGGEDFPLQPRDVIELKR